MSTEPEPRPKHRRFLAALGTALHAVLLFALFVILVAFIPPMKRQFDEFGLSLPWATKIVIRISHWLSEYWWALVPVAGLGLVADFAMTFALGRSGRVGALLWIASVALLLFVLGALSLASVGLAEMKLQEALSRRQMN